MKVIIGSVIILASLIIGIHSVFGVSDQFSNPISISKSVGDSGNSDIAIDGNNMYVVWNSASSSTSSQIYFAKSTDGGVTFGNGINISHNTDVAIAPSIAISGSNVFISWSATTGGSSNLFFVKSTDGGTTFGTPILIGGGYANSYGKTLVTSGNSIYVVYSGASNRISLAKSTDGGNTFTIRNIYNSTDYTLYPSIASSNGTLNIIWRDWIHQMIGFAKSTDGIHFSNSTFIGNGLSLTEPDIAVSDNGIYVVGRTTDGSQVQFSKSTNGGISFSDPIDIWKKGTEGRTVFTPKVATSGNNLYVLWSGQVTQGNYNSFQIFFSKSADNGVTFSQPVNISNTLGGTYSPSIVSSGNSLYVLWADDSIGGDGHHQILFSKRLIAIPQNITTNEDQPISITLSSLVDTPQTYSYSIISQPNHGTLLGTAPSLTYTPNTHYFGTDLFTFKTSLPDTNIANVTISVTPISYPPVASAGSNKIVKSGDTVILDGTNSTQPNNDVLTYSWLQSAGSPVTLSNKTNSKPMFTAPTVSSDTTLTFVLTITDKISGKTDSSSVTIIVKPLSPQTPQINQTTTQPTNQTTNLQTNSQTTPQIPSWVKGNAKYWHDGELGDDEFEKGIKYMIDNKIIKTSAKTQTNSALKTVPKWIKSDAGWWADGTITQDEFLKGIEYLVQKGIINVQ